MADDRIDWCDVAAVGLVADAWFDERPDRRVRSLLEHDLHGRLDPYQGNVDAIAAALREAFEAGLRERIDVLDCDACGERHMTERGAAMASENRALRRELAARRAVDGWLRESGDRYLEVGVLSGRLNACEGLTRLVASAPTYPALATALGLEVEDE